MPVVCEVLLGPACSCLLLCVDASWRPAACVVLTGIVRLSLSRGVATQPHKSE